MENLAYYKKFAPVPQNAQKKITGGKLNGKTDINPMWRIKMLTEAFGMCGFGWYTEITDHWVEEAGGETSAWVTINLFIKDPESGEWSKPIVGTGGSKQNGKGMGDGINDEAFKMAETDAISVACKKLGMGADIYWDADKTKYTNGNATPSASAPSAPSTTPKPQIRKGNALWGKALEYCVRNNVKAETLVAKYDIDAESIKALQKEIDDNKNA